MKAQRQPNPLPARSQGRPVAVAGLARLLLQMHQRPPARLVATAPAARTAETASA